VTAHVHRSFYDAKTAIHLALTLNAGGLGVSLALPQKMFATAHAYDFMSSLMPEVAWAAMMLIVATVGLIGAFSANRIVRFASALALATTHGLYALCLGLGPIYGPGVSTYGLLTGLGYYLVWRRTLETY